MSITDKPTSVTRDELRLAVQALYMLAAEVLSDDVYADGVEHFSKQLHSLALTLERRFATWWGEPLLRKE